MPCTRTGTLKSRSGLITNRANCGGNSKSGLPPSVGTGNRFSHRAMNIRAAPNKNQKFYISYANQIGGVGRHNSMTSASADGVNIKMVKFLHERCNNQPNIPC